MRNLVPLLPLVLLVALLLPCSAEGQLAIRGGVNLVDLFGDDVETSDARPRLAGGVGFDLIGLGPLTLAPEVYYAQKGAENFQRRLAEGESVEVSLSYVEVPVLLRLAIPVGGTRIQPYLAGGPVFGWQLQCEVQASATGAREDCGQLLGGEQQLEETLRNFEQGVMLGGGVAVELIPGFGALTFDARLARGLSRLSDRDDGPEIQNRALSLLVGYRFGLGG
ncbi:MAG: PorT family protein, partial [Gemmatimonadales bacterium]